MLKTAVDRLRRAIGRAGMVEEREDARGTPSDGPAECDQFGQVLRDASGELGDDVFEHLFPARGILVE